MHAIQRVHAQGKGQKAIAKLLGCGQNTVRRALASDPKFGERVAPRLLAAAKKNLPAPRARRALPPQLKQLDRAQHRELKRLVELWGAQYVSRWLTMEPDELLAHISGTSRIDAADVLARVRRLGLPQPLPCAHCGRAVTQEPTS